MSDRQNYIKTAASYIGCKESNGTHKQIIDIYNSHKPYARGYAMTYTTAWCAAFVTAMAIKCGLTDIIPKECSCNKMIELFKKLGSWVENDAYTPKPGDIIFYDWEDSGKGENTSESDHVGIVESVNGSTITVIEGNYNDAVARRTLKVNGRYIRGYGVPKYKDTATDTNVGTSSGAAAVSYKVGDIVNFTGSKHYANANAASGPACKAGKAKVTAISKDAKHPYHLIAVSGSGSNVYGWVDAADISGQTTSDAPAAWTPKVGDTVVYNGTKHYASANATSAQSCKGGKAKITQIYQLGKSKHPYHLVRVSGSGATVYGWVDAGTFTKA